MIDERSKLCQFKRFVRETPLLPNKLGKNMRVPIWSALSPDENIKRDLLCYL